MDKALTKDARGFVDGVVSYLRTDGKLKSITPKVEAFLHNVTSQTRKEKVAYVQSSVELAPGEKTSLAKLLEKLIGHEVSLEPSVNPDLLGGITIQVGDWVVDTSVKSQLEQMAQSLL
ncbi:ATP synthase F1 subunit delta [Candidatus Gottesmanbacteria bacterium RIFCSPLOWO2_01_FULL_46_9]|uniref:ATP synthase F1 subunit delta n=1 Tax=Candidatus Gottesmanbacteria bacterium RIFCSPLOWO2_01_FULL_46_9 TaxID=1798394 RepID=A0A1F6B3C5_9BACT|nr:MAG: ATP synthase F1 subunit delta [Candidatus Gottesmanbacteria bacterium RIFCSPLOWO2_01_FULL_46_9]